MMTSEAISGMSSPSIRLVIQLIRYRLGVSTMQEVETLLTWHQPDPAEVISFIRQREIAGLCYIPHYDASNVLREVMEGLKPEIAHRAGFNLAVHQRMMEVQQLFAGAGLTPVFYKGLMLGADLYGNLTTRFVSDIDVLVKRADFPVMRRLLLEHGYEEAYPYPPRYEDYFMKHTREAMFTKRDQVGVPVSVELQWAPMSAMYGIPDNDHYFLQYTVQKELAGQRFATVLPEQHILLLFIHHGIGDLWRSLRNVTDIASFLKKHSASVDWNLVKEKLVEWKIYRNALVGLHLSRRLFDAELPAAFSGEPDEKMMKLAMDTILARDMLPKEKKNFRNMYRQFSYLDGTGSRIRLLLNYIKTAVYPSMADLNRVDLPRYLFPLYFLLKPFRFLPRSGSRQSTRAGSARDKRQ